MKTRNTLMNPLALVIGLIAAFAPTSTHGRGRNQQPRNVNVVGGIRAN